MIEVLTEICEGSVEFPNGKTFSMIKHFPVKDDLYQCCL